MQPKVGVKYRSELIYFFGRRRFIMKFGDNLKKLRKLKKLSQENCHILNTVMKLFGEHQRISANI